MSEKNINPFKPILDAIRRDSKALGVVEDLYGNVFDPTDAAEAVSNRGWYFFSIPEPNVISIRDIYNSAVSNDVSVDFIPADTSSEVDLSSISDDHGTNNLLFLISGIRVPRATSIKLTVRSKHSDIYIYLNNTKLAEGQGAIEDKTIFLQDSSRNVLQIIIRRRRIQGATTQYFDGIIRFGDNSPATLAPPVPEAPGWDSSAPLIYGTLDSSRADNGMILTWEDSPFVGGWAVDRISYESLGTINSFTASGTTGYNFVVSGSVTGNNIVTIGDDLIGDVRDNTQGASTTTINVRSSVSSGSWTGEKLYTDKDVARVVDIDRKDVTTTASGLIRYVDFDIIETFPYTYRIASKSVFNKGILGDYSELKTKRAFDNTPPGGITLYPDASNAVSVEGDLVTVTHQYPSDPDLAGYRVYNGDADSLVVDLRRGSRFLRLDNIQPSGTSGVTRYGELDFIAKQRAGFDTESIVEGYVITTYDFAGNEQPFASGTSIDIRLFVDIVENFTAFDNVSSPRPSQRKPSTIPQHLWDTSIKILQENIRRASND